MNAIKQIFATLLVVMMLVGIGASAMALSFAERYDVEDIPAIDVQEVKINGDVYQNNDVLVVKRGEKLYLHLRLKANTDIENAQIEASIYGYDYGDVERELVSDVTPSFDMNAGDVTYKDLELEIPIEMDKQLTKIRIIVSDSNGFLYTYNLQLRVEGVDRDHSVIVDDFALSPSTVEAGRGVTALVKVSNVGDESFDFVKVVVSIPALGVDATEYLDELNPDQSLTVSEMQLLIPSSAKAGTYDVVVKVYFDKYGETEARKQITITATQEQEQQQNEGKTTVTLPGPQTVVSGEEVAFPIIITNTGSSAKTYTLSVKNADGFSVRFEPGSAVIVNGGESKTVYLYVSPVDVPVGSKTLTVTISDGATTQEGAIMVQVAKKANGWETAKLVIEILLVVLILVLAVIGLVLAFKKRKNSEEEEEPYY